MLALVAATTAVRRAGVVPGPLLDELAIPDGDDRRPCVPAAVDRWHHITASWPVLEDEWMLTLVTAGWRIAPELLPAMLVYPATAGARAANAAAATTAAAATAAPPPPDSCDEHSAAGNNTRGQPSRRQSQFGNGAGGGGSAAETTALAGVSGQ
jgi:hypothetical protein